MVTKEQIEAAKKSNGGKGWTRTQLAQWGVDWPPQKGWKSKLEHKERKPFKHSVKDEAWQERETERLSMKKLYQEKSGDYSY